MKSHPYQKLEKSNFAQTLEDVCVKTVERGQMTKDLALLISRDQAFQTTDEFLDTLDQNMKAAANF